VPRFLPRHIRAMLEVGEELSDIRRVLPVCRATLPSGASSTQKNVNSLIVLLFVSPVGPVLLWVLWIFVFPKFEMIMEDMAPGTVWSSSPFQWSLVLANLILAAWLLFFIGTCFQGVGEWILRTMAPSCAGVIDALSLRIPWRRRRVQRDFSALLALLLDAGVPEEKSVRLAAQGTGNRGFQKRAERVVADLREGVKLPEAVRWLDPRGEFRWRLQNACHAPNRFVTALSGWQDALEAKAFQQEQFFSQGLTTGFVLLNGIMVGLATITVFQALASITEIALW
jgi:type II secretory pathway component PulF